MKELKSFLASSRKDRESVNFHLGIVALDNNEELYREVLQMFVDKYRKLNNLEQLLQEKTLDELGPIFTYDERISCDNWCGLFESIVYSS